MCLYCFYKDSTSFISVSSGPALFVGADAPVHMQEAYIAFVTVSEGNICDEGEPTFQD